jgi:hypothetical protein
VNELTKLTQSVIVPPTAQLQNNNWLEDFDYDADKAYRDPSDVPMLTIAEEHWASDSQSPCHTYLDTYMQCSPSAPKVNKTKVSLTNVRATRPQEQKSGVAEEQQEYKQVYLSPGKK